MPDDEYDFEVLERTISVSFRNVKHTYEIVEKIPEGGSYFVWAVHMPEGYLPLCQLAKKQPENGRKKIAPHTLKAVKVEGAEHIVWAAMLGCDTVEKMEDYLMHHPNPEPESWEEFCVDHIKVAVPVLKSIL